MNNTWFSWSSGKDSAFALYQLMQNPEYQVTGLFTTINKNFDRVAMHAVRHSILRAQAKSIGIPLYPIFIPHPCSNEIYKSVMSTFIDLAIDQKITHMAFGDLYLEDIKSYRQKMLANIPIEPIFPIWKTPTNDLAHMLIDEGFKAKVTCIDPKKLPTDFVGRDYNLSFLDDLPEGIDPCGENGEFHTIVYDGPLLKFPLFLKAGEIVEREGFVFADFELIEEKEGV